MHCTGDGIQGWQHLACPNSRTAAHCARLGFKKYTRSKPGPACLCEHELALELT